MTGRAGSPVVHGIDFGTSTSKIMVGRPGVPALLIRDPTAAHGEMGIPTSVCARRDGSLAVGYEAERIKRIRIHDYRTGFKLEIGQPVSYRLGTADYSPDGLMTAVIRFLRERALAEVPAEPDVVLVTVPGAWEEGNRDLTVRACVSAGYDPARVRIETEPVAALADVGPVPGRTVIYDLGGGTFNCVVALDAGGGPRIYGDPFGLPQIGGRAFDDRILRYVRNTFPQAAKIFVSDADDTELLRRRIQLREKCVRAKIELSFIPSIEDLLSELDPPEMLELDRAVLSGMIDDLVEQTVDECERMLRSLDLSWPDVGQCVLIGGSSRVPLVGQRMRDRSGRLVRILEEPELAVVRGATALALGLVTPTEPAHEPVPPEPGPGGSRAAVREFTLDRNLFLEDIVGTELDEAAHGTGDSHEEWISVVESATEDHAYLADDNGYLVEEYGEAADYATADYESFDPPEPQPDRYLVGEMPSRIRVGRELSLIASITAGSPGTGQAAVPLPGLFPGHEGVKVTLIARPDAGLLILGEEQQTVTVPQYGGSPPVRFAFQARSVGLARVRVTSWLGGAFLAELRLEVSVESGEPMADSQRHSAAVGALRADSGEVTLQVHSDGSRYSFQLLSQRYLFGPVVARSLTEEPGQAVERTVAMLRKMAGGASGYTPELAARWVRETGTGLWQDLVPRVIQDQFWQLRDSITAFNIACEDDKVPWELLYPLRPNDDEGFLVEQFPVLRRVYDQGRSDRVSLGHPQYVVPPHSPENAQAEVAAIARILGHLAGPAVTDLADLLQALDAGSTGLLHFACHNTFSAQTGGSSINMAGGAFVPQLLNSAVGRRCLADRSPLIFINACRSAGVSAEYTHMMGWASQFMAAGAGAFIGTLWPVRSSQASLFAEAFYAALTAGENLGRASLTARQATKDDADPTWLAYTAYGDPAALGAP